ncbi:hypothetical protein [Natrinema salifodinae]|uniref:Rpa-associated protein n=1 Tax=Natrinema salifodinae TaxID=1202768 RepID=A0A1I0M116_9EURY|nr:hypothetical protein [Natrinema salifodinae]SEV80743.1 hypothetical protein SAMN05216285_0146 [Natrinema salifodinae]
MSANGNGDGDDEIPGREIAYRLFAAEYDDASLSYAESDEERAPNYVISPTGARLNRVFAVGTLTEVSPVNDEMVRARVVDPTGAFVVYAGQYQPDELAFLEQIDPPAFVAVTGKARTFQPEDGDRVYTSLRPESLATVDADTRDRWVVSAAEQTIERIAAYSAAADLDAGGEALTDALLEADVESGLAAGLPLAQDHYGTTPSYLAALRDCALEAVEVVAGERDQVSGLDLAPDDTSPEYETTFDALAELDGIDPDALEGGVATDPDAAADTETEPAEPIAATTGGAATDADEPEAHSGSAAGTATSATSDEPDAAEVDAEPAAATAGAGTGTESDSGAADAEADATAAAASTDQAESDTDTDTETAVDETAGDDVESGPEPESEPEPESAATDTDDEPLAAENDAPAADEAESAEPEPAAVDESDEPEPAADKDGELGDFDAGSVDDGMYEMDEEEREQIEAEFGAEFTTGSEVDEPGEADIDVPEPDESAESAEPADDDPGEPPASGLESEPVDESEAAAETADAAEPEPTDDESEPATDDADDSAVEDEPADDVDLEAYVVETMEELDDGDGADRTELVETVAADTGAAEAAVEDAIQDALMGGQCYEPDDETLKAI